MATTSLRLSTKIDSNGKSQVLLRFSAKRGLVLRAKTGIFAFPDDWSETTNTIKDSISSKILSPEQEQINQRRKEEKAKINSLCTFITDSYDNASKEEQANVNSIWLDGLIDKFNHPKEATSENRRKTLIEYFSEFILKHPMSDGSLRHAYATKFALERFEKYQSKITGSEYVLMLDSVNSDTLASIKHFYKEEYKIQVQHPELYTFLNKNKHPKAYKERGDNYINRELKVIRAFFNWCIRNNYTSNYPFKGFEIKGEVYGTPYYLTLEERNKLYEFDFSNRPQIGVQRDIFIFQCNVGCRVGDLMSLTKDNIKDGFLEYIPIKTKDGKGKTVRVSLNKIAKEILNKYADFKGKRLFPFISPQKYNEDIKTMLRLAEIDRVVTILDPVTRNDVQKPICEVASSHMARRTFIGNIYKKVQDPNLICQLTGHTEGSKAFTRYREIDDDINKQLTASLDN